MNAVKISEIRDSCVLLYFIIFTYRFSQLQKTSLVFVYRFLFAVGQPPDLRRHVSKAENCHRFLDMTFKIRGMAHDLRLTHDF